MLTCLFNSLIFSIFCCIAASFSLISPIRASWCRCSSSIDRPADSNWVALGSSSAYTYSMVYMYYNKYIIGHRHIYLGTKINKKCTHDYAYICIYWYAYIYIHTVVLCSRSSKYLRILINSIYYKYMLVIIIIIYAPICTNI